MNRHHVFLFLHRGEQLTARVPATRPDRLAWVGVTLANLSNPNTVIALRREGVHPISTDMPIYWIRKFEVERARAEADVWLWEPDLLEKWDSVAMGDEDLVTQLEKLGVDLEELERPFKTDYPI